MTQYRLYYMNSFTGHITSFDTIEAGGDREAIDLADRKVGRQPMELWREGVKLRRFEAAGQKPAEIRLTLSA